MSNMDAHNPATGACPVLWQFITAWRKWRLKRKVAHLEATATKIRNHVSRHGFHRPEWLNENDLRLAEACDNRIKQLKNGI